VSVSLSVLQVCVSAHIVQRCVVQRCVVVKERGGERDK